MAEFCMPSLGADMEAGTLVEWKVATGDRVSRGDIIAVVETDKSAVEIESFETGAIGELRVQPGEKVTVGTVLATIDSADVGEAQPPPVAVDAPVAADAPVAVDAPVVVDAPVAKTSRSSAGRPRVRISPAARKLARELGVATAGIAGTGLRGAVSMDDIRRAAEVGAQTAHRDRRRAISAAMTRANRDIPQYYLSTVIDVSSTLAWLEAHNANESPEDRILLGALLIKAVALAVRKVPELNGHNVDGVFRPSERINVGMAVSLRGGDVIAPAISDADQCSLRELMRRLRDMVARARSGRVRGSELTDATITITSLGDGGCDEVLGIINPPQVAMVGFGTTAQRPWVVEGVIVPRQVVTATLSADHRVSDGLRGARFLSKLAEKLQEPEEL